MDFCNFLNRFFENFRKVFPPRKVLDTPMFSRLNQVKLNYECE